MRRARTASLRRDMALGFGLGLVAVWLAALLIGWVVLREEIDEIYDAALMRTADRLLSMSGQPPATPRGGAMMAELIGPDGTVRFHSVTARAARGTAHPTFTDEGDMRVLSLRTADGSLLRVGDPLAERREATREALVALLVPSLLLLPLAFFGASWFTRRRLAPVVTLSREVASRGGHDLTPLTPLRLPEELQPVHEAVDHLMARLSAALEAERAFSANAAHEIRTPIAAALAQSQRLLAEAGSPATADRARTIIQALQRLARLSAKLLDLARAEGAAATLASPTDMRPILSMVIADLGGGVTDATPHAAVPVLMDVDDFAVLARNLIENALAHGQPPVTLTLTPEALVVENAGPAVPTALLPTLTRRFQRGTSRAEGAGLGLAIADNLARRAGGRLILTSPLPGQPDGFRAEMQFGQASRIGRMVGGEGLEPPTSSV